MNDFYKPDYGSDSNNPFARNSEGKLVRRGYWLDMSDNSLILTMKSGVGAHLSNTEKKLHLEDIGRANLIGDICVQEILPPNT